MTATTSGRTHGKPATYAAGCRCDACRRAAIRRQKLYRMQTGHDGRNPPPRPILVDRAPVVEHYDALKASGWRVHDIAEEVGVSAAHLSWTMTNTRHTKIRRDLADAVLAVEPLTPVDVDPVVVDRLVAAYPARVWDTLGATRAERLAAAARLDALGRGVRVHLDGRGYGDQQTDVPSRRRIDVALSLRAGRDYATRDQEAS